VGITGGVSLIKGILEAAGVLEDTTGVMEAEGEGVSGFVDRGVRVVVNSESLAEGIGESLESWMVPPLWHPASSVTKKMPATKMEAVGERRPRTDLGWGSLTRRTIFVRDENWLGMDVI
jgi:hypothetical protein